MNFLSVIILVAVLLALAFAWYRTWHRPGYSFGQTFLYFVNWVLNRLLWHTTVEGSLPVRNDEGAILVCNHRAGIDPLLIQISTDRVVHWLVAREYVEHPLMSWVLRTVGSIPVNRGGVDIASTKAALRTAQKGGLVGLFPEGKINTTEDLLLPGRSGAAMIAIKARVPVIPVYIEGSPYRGTPLSSFFMFARAKVKIGEPIDISAYYGRERDKDVLAELTLRLLSAIAALAGRQDFQPRVAGKQWLSAAEVEP